MPEENDNVRYWKVSPGTRANNWEEFKDNNWISIGWYNQDWRKTKFGDLTKDRNKESIMKVLKKHLAKEHYSDRTIAKVADDLIRFFEIKQEDKVIAYDKDLHINAMGKVIGDYEFDEDFNFPHTKSVKWLKIFSVPLDIRPIKEKLTKIWLPPTVIEMKEKDWDILYKHSENEGIINKQDKENGTKMTINSEDEFIKQIHDYIQARGFIFELNLIKNYYISLKTKPFVILTGISGTGKTKLAEFFADAVVEDYENQFKLIPVRPDWTNDKYLVGYYNPITKEYMSSDFIKLLIRAKLDSNNPYFVCLDEMNLARVEYYFSKFLSGLESKDKIIHLHEIGDYALQQNDKIDNLKEFSDLQERYEKNEIAETELKELEIKGLVISSNHTLIPSKIEIPENLYFTGTVNMYETTFQFSPKVLDRANTIEILGPSKQEDFFKLKKDDIDETEIPEVEDFTYEANVNGKKDFLDKTGIPELFKAGMKNHPNYKWPEELKDKIWKLYEILQKDDTHRYDLHFGHRTVNEIGNYLGNSQGLLDQETAFDLQILQKILPKIKGDESIKGLLEKLKIEIEPYRLSSEKLTIIEQRLNDRMYTSFF